jgi:hypothetical protein
MNEHPEPATPHGIEPDPCHTRDFNNVAAAVGAGRRAAEEKAKAAVPTLKGAVKTTIHDLAYGAAFGVCFAGYFAREMVPAELRRTVVRGLQRGQTAAKAAAAELRGPVETPAAVEAPAPAAI